VRPSRRWAFYPGSIIQLLGHWITEALRGLKWLEPTVDLLRLGCFVVFVALGLLAARGSGRPGARRRADVLIVYVLAVTAVVGLVQQESWPFTTWSLVSGTPARQMTSLEVEGLDASGRAWVIDLRVVQPLSPEELASWLKANEDRLGPSGKENLGRFLLGRVEEGRRRFLDHGRAAPNQWILGSADTPYHFHDAKTWKSAAQVPDSPFTALRAWFLEWDIDERYADDRRVSRRLLFEYKRPSGDGRSL
jgi:hypothetical protein